MNFSLEGKLIEKFDTQQVTDTFKKREFVVETNEEFNGREFVQYIKFQLIQDKSDLIEPFEKGQNVKVNFSIRGNRWEKDDKVSYFTNLDAWRIEPVDAESNQEAPPPPDDEVFGEEPEDLPF